VPGDVCLKETCGNNLGRCYRFCRTDNDCSPTVCLTRVSSDLMACNQGNVPCQAFANTGCADPALVCYVTGTTQTACDCPNPAALMQEGKDCISYNDCASGLACLAVLGRTSRCYRLCDPTMGCTDSTKTCTPIGSAGYYCE
jgi:hypothetical protein